MSYILKSRGPVHLLRCGFDCDIYAIKSDRLLVYKHYAKYKLGSVLFGRSSPATFIQSLSAKHPSCLEHIIDIDDEGYLTFSYPPAGDFLFYRAGNSLDKRLGNTTIKAISNLLREVHHNDLTPDNILVGPSGLIVTDWSCRNEQPYYSFLSDSDSMNNLVDCVRGRKIWFPIVNYKMLQIYALKMGLSYMYSQEEFDPVVVARCVFARFSSSKILEECGFRGEIPFDSFVSLFEFFTRNHKELMKENILRIKQWVKR
jgi:hypothetical protein